MFLENDAVMVVAHCPCVPTCVKLSAKFCNATLSLLPIDFISWKFAKLVFQSFKVLPNMFTCLLASKAPVVIILNIRHINQYELVSLHIDFYIIL